MDIKSNRSDYLGSSNQLVEQFEIKSLYAKTYASKTKYVPRSKASWIDFWQNRENGKISLICTEKSSNRVILDHMVPIPEEAKGRQRTKNNCFLVKWYAVDTTSDGSGSAKKKQGFGCALEDHRTASQFAEMLKTAGINNMEDRNSPPNPKPVGRKRYHHELELQKFIVSSAASTVSRDDDDQKYNALQLVDLTEGRYDYKLIHSQFMRSSRKRTDDLEQIFIYKIQQRARIAAHESKKKQMLKLLGGDVSKLNEIGLYHGTQLDKLPPILHQGFLRQFVSRAVYGKGTYFARNANYSCNSSYAKPDADGFQHVLYCNVICGEWVEGESSMKMPPIKKDSEYLPYETTVDNEYNPTIFVSYQDDQALPLYLISFKTSN